MEKCWDHLVLLVKAVGQISLEKKKENARKDLQVDFIFIPALNQLILIYCRSQETGNMQYVNLGLNLDSFDLA